MTPGSPVHADPDTSRELAVRAELERAAEVLATGLALLREHGDRLDADATTKVLERLQEQTEAVALVAASLGPQVLDLDALAVYEAPDTHVADAALAATVGCHLAVELRLGGSALVVATRARRADIEANIRSLGFPLDTLARAGRYRWVDAASAIDNVVEDGTVDGRRFDDVVGRLARSMRSADFGLRTYCEVGALLRAEGDDDAAADFDALWSRLRTDDGVGWLGGRSLHAAA